MLASDVSGAGEWEGSAEHRSVRRLAQDLREREGGNLQGTNVSSCVEGRRPRWVFAGGWILSPRSALSAQHWVVIE